MYNTKPVKFSAVEVQSNIKQQHTSKVQIPTCTVYFRCVSPVAAVGCNSTSTFTQVLY